MWPLTVLSGDDAAAVNEEGDNMKESPPKPNWKSVRDDATGKFYYYHRVTKQRSWTKPETYDEERDAYREWKKKTKSEKAKEVPKDEEKGPEASPAPYDETTDSLSKFQDSEVQAKEGAPHKPAPKLLILGENTPPASNESVGKVKEDQEVVVASNLSSKPSSPVSNTVSYIDPVVSASKWDRRPKPEAIIFPSPKSASKKKAKKVDNGPPSKPVDSTDKKQQRGRMLGRKSSTTAPGKPSLLDAEQSDQERVPPQKGLKLRKYRRSVSPEKRPNKSRPLFRSLSPEKHRSRALADKKLESTVKSFEEERKPRELVIHYVMETQEDQEPKKTEQSTSWKDKLKPGIPAKVHVPFLKRRSKSWNNDCHDKYVADVVDDEDSIATPSTLSRSSNDNSIESSGDQPEGEMSEWEKFEHMCAAPIFSLCEMMDPCDGGFLNQQPQVVETN